MTVMVVGYVLAAILILIFLYCAGRMISAGVFRSWVEMNKKKQEEEGGGYHGE